MVLVSPPEVANAARAEVAAAAAHHAGNVGAALREHRLGAQDGGSVDAAVTSGLPTSPYGGTPTGSANASFARLGADGGHVPGLRYLVNDVIAGASYASPLSKLGTLVQDSLRAVARIRGDMDRSQAAAEALAGDNPMAHEDLLLGSSGTSEVCARASHDCWVCARNVSGREVVVCLEKGGDTLLEASAAAAQLGNVLVNY